MSDQPVAETTTYTKHDKRKRRTATPLAGFELAIPAIERPQTCALNRAATGFFFCGAVAQLWPRPPHCWGL